MTDKAYIVANKKQELDVLKKLENNGFKWGIVGTLPTKFHFSEALSFNGFPYIIGVHEDIGWIGWSYYSDDYEGDVIYDGRKEDKMYKVTQEFMDELVEWRDEYTKSVSGVNAVSLTNMPEIVRSWRFEYNSSIETNKRFGAIINWINGEDVFDIGEPHKFIVRNDTPDYDGDYYYVQIFDGVTDRAFSLEGATKFDTREEAQEWANSHQVVVEIDEDGNEVE